jgi:hypothetical protein
MVCGDGTVDQADDDLGPADAAGDERPEPDEIAGEHVRGTRWLVDADVRQGDRARSHNSCHDTDPIVNRLQHCAAKRDTP